MAFPHRAVAAEETGRTMTPDGLILHAGVRIGGSILEVSDARALYAPTLTAIHVQVSDVDGVYGRALEAGVASVAIPANQFYDSRESGVKDKWGNTCWIPTHIEDLF